jgi:hypothetical protein
MGCKNSIDVCPCTAACSKKGNCCDCVAYHVPYGQFPACFFSKEGEKTYDRSLEKLIEDRK